MNASAIGQILIAAVLVGGALWLLSLAPINDTIKKVATGLVVILAVIWAIRLLVGMF